MDSTSVAETEMDLASVRETEMDSDDDDYQIQEDIPDIDFPHPNCYSEIRPSLLNELKDLHLLVHLPPLPDEDEMSPSIAEGQPAASLDEITTTNANQINE